MDAAFLVNITEACVEKRNTCMNISLVSGPGSPAHLLQEMESWTGFENEVA